MKAGGYSQRGGNMVIYEEKQRTIAEKLDFDAKKSHWKDWKWQMRHLIKDIVTFERLTGIRFETEIRQQLEKTAAKFPISITPYYLSLIEVEDYQNDPVFKQSFPSLQELVVQDCEMTDPLDEEADSPVPGITHRYPDRVLFHISNTCAMYCRHCTRKRKVGDIDFVPGREVLTKGIDYIKSHSEVRDVLLSGGDPFLLSDEYLDWILGEIRGIQHVEVIRIGTRTPVVLPYRITAALTNIIKKYHPIWINTHFNHPRELTPSAMEALEKLANAGVPLGNQSVLLAGINDCPRIIKKLVHKLVQNRVRPYYLYQCDLSEGLSHFRTPVGKGIEIMESLRGHTSGFAIPTFVIDAPGGGGKIPVMPNYLLSWSVNKVVLRNYEGIITTYIEPEQYQNTFCNRNCKDCHLQLKLERADETKAIGIERLLSDWDETNSLIPENSPRMERRE
jgi:lysine 2,3-aminomutase